MPSVSEIISIAKISQYLAANAIRNGGLFGAGIDPLLPRKLYNIRKDVEWLYDLDSSDDTLISTANYLYALCAPFNGEASIIATANAGGVIVTPTTGQAGGIAIISLEFELGVTSSPVIVNGTSVTLPNDGDNSITLPMSNIFNGSLLLTIGGVPQPTIVTTNSTYTSISYSPTQAIITLGPTGNTFSNENTYIISGLQITST